MARHSSSSVSRRRFLGRTLAAAAVVPLAPALTPMATAAAVDDRPSAPTYRVLTPGEAAFTEALVNVRCPADRLTPDGVSSGLASFIDRHLAAATDAPGQAQRELFKAGVAAADAACVARYGGGLAALSAADARGFVRDMGAGEVAAPFPLASWSAEVVDALLKQACFSEPIYSAYDGRMFWKLFG